MKKQIVLLSLLLLFSTSGFAQIKNAGTKMVKVYGTCFMCKAKIEKAGNRKNVAKVDWNLQTQMATLTYDTKITTSNKILKRIALAGFDNEKYLAPDAAYSKLDQCCRYERVAKHQYECVMCKTTSDKPGKCPICNMDMTKKKKK